MENTSKELRMAFMNAVEQKIKAGARIVDVRTWDEFEDEHFPGAVCVPVDEIMAKAEELGPKNTPIVLYCASGARSAYAARILKSMGFADVTNAGGLYDMPGF